MCSTLPKLSILFYLFAQCHACLPHSGVPALAPPANYPLVTGMEIRALGVLMSGILETKAMNMVSTSFVTGPGLPDIWRTRSLDAISSKQEPELPHTSFRPPCFTRRHSFAGLLDLAAMNSFVPELAPLQTLQGLQIRGGHGSPSTVSTRTALQSSSPTSSSSPSPYNQSESSALAAMSPNVNEEPLYPPVSEGDRVWAVVAGAAAAALQVVWSSTLVGGLLRSSLSFASAALLTAFLRRDWRMQRQLVPEEAARYPGSRFVNAGAVRAHYLEALPADGSPPRLSLLLVHGFGASARSYHACLQPLADQACARVLSVDMPGFGLTSRPRTLKHYDAAAMITGVVNALNLKEAGPVVVVGHSLGGLASARYLLSSPSPPDAAVLVAPAIIAPGSSGKGASGGAVAEGERGARAPPARNNGGGAAAEGGLAGVKGALQWAGAVVGAMGRLAGATMAVGVVGVMRGLTPLLALVLRVAVYTKAFWSAGLAAAYHDREKLTETTVEGYRRGSWVRGWEAGVLNFVWFRVTGGKSVAQTLREALRAPQEEGLVETLAATAGGGGGEGGGAGAEGVDGAEGVEGAGKGGMPVLLVHGEQDRIIPCGNSRRLAERTGCELAAIDACGHCPMEETPDAFARIVADFVSKRVPP